MQNSVFSCIGKWTILKALVPMVILLNSMVSFGGECIEDIKIKDIYKKGNYSKSLNLMIKDTACIEKTRNNWLVFLIENKDTINLKKLLKKGYPTHFDNGQLSGKTVLHSACFFKEAAYTRILLENGADINHKDGSNITPFLEAVRHGYDFCEPLFKYKPDVNVVAWNGETPLFLACKWDRIKLALKLLQMGAKVNRQNKKGYTPLMSAVLNNNSQLISSLLSAGADVSLKDEDGNNILFYGVKKGSIPLFELLIKNEADIKSTNSYGATLLISAAYHERKDLVEYFLGKNLNIDARNINGETAFMFTAYNKTPNIAELLKKRGADIGIKDKYSNNALDKAIESENSVMIPYFKKLGLKQKEFYSGLTSAQMQEIIEKNEMDKIKKFTKGQADTVYRSDVTPMHMAADLSNLSAIKALVKKGARPNAINGHGYTPLMFCIMRNNWECIEYLLSLNIDINKVQSTYHCQTAIYEAIKSKDARIVRKLLNYGANINLTDYDDVSPLDLATCKSTKEIIKMVFEKTDEALLRNPNKDSPHYYARKYCDNSENAQYVKSLIESKYGKDITKRSK